MTFKVGDKVVRKVEHRTHMWKFGGDAVTVFRADGGSIDVGDGNGCLWDKRCFDLLPAEVTVSNETQLPGLPDGYRAVRFGPARLNDEYLNCAHPVKWNTTAESAGHYLIVEKITPPEPPKPKTRSVVLNRYLVWDADTTGTHRVIVAEEGYVSDNWQNFTLLGHSETIEVEV
jgi:hypothetical protein